MSEDPITEPTVEELKKLRRLGFAIAYRMLGSVADAEEIVQEAFVRLLHAQKQNTEIHSRKAYLAAITTRLAIDQLKSARARREVYVGTWLPEPLVEDMQGEMMRQDELADSLSMAFLLMLETLSPIERAVYLLRQVFEYEYTEIGEVVGKSGGNCRQIFLRSKLRLTNGERRFTSSAEQTNEISKKFLTACRSGNLAGLVDLLAEDVTFYGDGGGRARAITKPVVGRNRVALFLHGLLTSGRQLSVTIKPVMVNGVLGAKVLDNEQKLISVLSVQVSAGVISAVMSIVNPDKLGHLRPLSKLLHNSNAE